MFDIPEEDLRRYEELYQFMENNTPEFEKERRRESLRSNAEIGEFEVKDPKSGGMREIQYGNPFFTIRARDGMLTYIEAYDADEAQG